MIRVSPRRSTGQCCASLRRALLGSHGVDAPRLWGYGPIFNRPGACTDPPGTLPPCFAPGSLHQAGLRLLSRRACGRSYRHALDATMLCSIDRTGARRAHACPGDSGSPLAVRDGGSWVQVGVVASGAEVKRRRCDDTRLPMVTADVPSLRGWIDRASRRLSARGTLLPGGTDEGYFGERVAAVYDEHSAGMFDPAVVAPAVERLAELTGDGAALEFAIGTGRIALPLAERGVRVAGIDNSEAMLARLREKPGAERIEAFVGDMAATRVDGEFALVYLVFNTIFNLTSQDGQVACFENAAAHLRSRRAVRDRGARAGAAAAAARADRPAVARRPRRDVLLRLRRRHAAAERPALPTSRTARIRASPIEMRYAWPAELDLMARLAGHAARAPLGRLEPRAVHGLSPAHVSVYSVTPTPAG